MPRQHADGIDDAGSAVDLAYLPVIDLLRGNLAGYWAVRVNRQKRVIIRSEDGIARNIDPVDYRQIDMQTRMRNPSHPGRVVRDRGFADGTPPAAMAERLGIDLAELQPVLDGYAPMTPSPALALETAGVSNASFWMRLQGSYYLAQERLRREVAGTIPAAVTQ